MESSNWISTILINNVGDLLYVKIKKGLDINRVMVFHCIIENHISFDITINDDGNWIDIKKGITEYSKLLGETIENYFE